VLRFAVLRFAVLRFAVLRFAVAPDDELRDDELPDEEARDAELRDGVLRPEARLRVEEVALASCFCACSKSRWSAFASLLLSRRALVTNVLRPE
jgi:hypothetical protein